MELVRQIREQEGSYVRDLRPTHRNYRRYLQRSLGETEPPRVEIRDEGSDQGDDHGQEDVQVVRLQIPDLFTLIGKVD